jgi:hypothetical protein
VVHEDVVEVTTNKSDLHGTREGVIIRPANDFTYVKAVGDPTLSSGVEIATARVDQCQQQLPVLLQEGPQIPKGVVTRMHRDVWEYKLRSHPDREFADEIISFIDYGVPIYYDGPILNQQFPNWGSCDLLRKEVKSSLIS